ncbi:TatD family hydrolase [Chryseobacterium potabilaquae]|uniref:Putative metal-dependent hydrolase YcfH n=1 Tax=Chryseobacterium potabilaquae TaxID=2675057 RepID=A0A6N4X8B6_9FLAO|nr:TatD family hydrolase [Chryseobacterium potabilaquae]CAA7195732.1 putative metal-dependent hydrolase YcfH [Chryseobacterium potabilaquae]
MDYFDFHHHKKNISYGIYNLEYNEAIPSTLYSVGIHPRDINCNSIENQIDWLTSNISDHCFAIGECGLDSLVPIDPKIQEMIFIKQIQLSNEMRKPLIIHCVRKFYEVISFKKQATQAMIIHGFNKKQGVAEDLLKNNFYLSVGKAVLYNLSLQNTIRITPLDKLFLETDNDDFIIEELYKKVSLLKGISLKQLSEQILENLDTIRNG